MLALAQFAVAQPFASVNLALPAIAHELHFALGSVQWLVSGFSLAYGSILVVAGRVADRFGSARLLVSGAVIFCGAGICGAVAQSQSLLLGAMCAQGAGAALMSPAIISLTSAGTRAGRQRSTAFTALAAAGYVALGVGVLTGGVLTAALGWRAVMISNAVPAAAVAAGAVGLLRVHVAGDTQGVNFASAAILVAGIVLALLTITSAGSTGVLHHYTWVAGAATVAALGTFVQLERTAATPLIHRELLKRTLITGVGLGFVASAVYSGLFVLVSLSFQRVLHFSPAYVGLAYLPMVVLMTAASGPLAAWFIPRVGFRVLIVVGLITLAAGAAILAAEPLTTAFVPLALVGLIVAGVGRGLTYAPIVLVTVSGAATHRHGLAAGMLTAAQQMGGAVGIVLLVSVLTASSSAAQLLADRGTQLSYGLAGLLAVGAALLATTVMQADPSLHDDS